MDDATLALLQKAFVSESRSFLQYVKDAFPWTTSEELAALARLQALIAEERDGTGALAQFLTRQRQPLPYVGSYPMSFTTMNFVSLQHLLPLLAREERRALADRENELARIHDAEAREVLRTIVEMKRRHLQTLQEMAAAYPESHSTVKTSA